MTPLRPSHEEKPIDSTSQPEDADLMPRDNTQRTLRPRHIHLITIGGSIGTVLFVQIGAALSIGGPGSLLLAFILWSTVVVAMNNCLAEMVCWIPISSPYIRFADRFVDEALGFSSGLNWFITVSLGVPYEITAFTLMLNFWTDKIPVEAVVVFMLVVYSALNIFAVRYYGESEFWLSIGKVLLIVGLLLFSFVAMLGGNPLRDRFGFRNWEGSKVHGAPFAEFGASGATGRFFGFLSALIQACFTIVGPEYLAITAGEAASPRTTLPPCFRSIIFRLMLFFVLGALAVGILVPYNDPNLLSSTPHRPGSGTSPYVIALTRLNLAPLAHIVNAAVMLSIFSAGNSYVYNASRTLFGMALEGRVPRVFARCSKSGVPVYCVGVVMCFGLLAFMQVDNTSAAVLLWITRFLTVSALANYAMIAYTYLRFRAALKAQNIARSSLPWCGRFQPFSAYYALTACILMCFLSGYSVFLPGHWNTMDFVFSYAVLAILPLIFLAWKVVKRTKARDPKTVDLFAAEREALDREETTNVR
ncbi:General amino acid permease [Mycena kentingensis (nom. inval.)]|nr:General amino acid permease [Mycena kentingensis (nom. inval.)]